MELQQQATPLDPHPTLATAFPTEAGLNDLTAQALDQRQILVTAPLMEAGFSQQHPPIFFRFMPEEYTFMLVTKDALVALSKKQIYP